MKTQFLLALYIPLIPMKIITLFQFIYSIPTLMNTPFIEYSNILNTKVVQGLGSTPKIIKFKGCIQFDLFNTKSSGSFSNHASNGFLFGQSIINCHAVSVEVLLESGPTSWIPATTENSANCSLLDVKLPCE